MPVAKGCANSSCSSCHQMALTNKRTNSKRKIIKKKNLLKYCAIVFRVKKSVGGGGGGSWRVGVALWQPSLKCVC